MWAGLTVLWKLRVTMTTRLSQNVADKYHINNLNKETAE